MSRSLTAPLACAFMATTILVASAAVAQPIQNGWQSDNARGQFGTVGGNTTRMEHYERHDNDRYDTRREDHRNDRRDDRHDDFRTYRGHSGSRVTVNVNNGYGYNRGYYNHGYYPAYREPTVVYYDRYPRPYPYYYTSSYYSQRPIPVVTESPYVEVRCSNRPITGTIVGGTAGALIGNQFGRGHHDRTAATIGGALLGLVIGNSVDRANESCAYQALEYGQSGSQVAWVNPDDDYSYSVTPGDITRTNDGRYCREYQAQVMVGGRLQDGYGQACRQPDGSWEVVD